MASEGSSSTSAMDSSEKKEVMTKAAELLAQGKRNMVCGEVPKAVNVYEEAVKLLVQEFGELSYNCADAYFNCGSAFLELGRMETNVLGTALEGVDVEEEKEEAASEQFEKPPADDDEQEDDDKDDDQEDAAEGEDEGTEENAEESQDEDKEEDVPNFQLAWEHLDLAKVIYLKNDNKDDQLKAAECHLKLGEVSMETEQHATAAVDLKCALDIQEKYLPADDRLIAETHYQLGLAYGIGKEFELSIKHYQSAVDVIEAKIASLHKLVEEKEVDAEDKENRETDALKKYKDEIKELQDLLPEMKNKIEDTKVEAKELDKMKEMAKEVFMGLAGSTKGFGSPTKKTEATNSNADEVDENGEKKASDIAHLVRKKRKQDEAPASVIEVKKIKQDGPAGDAESEAKVNGATEASGVPEINGVAEMNGEAEMNGHDNIKESDSGAAAEPEPMTV